MKSLHLRKLTLEHLLQGNYLVLKACFLSLAAFDLILYVPVDLRDILDFLLHCNQISLSLVAFGVETLKGREGGVVDFEGRGQDGLVLLQV